MKLPFRNKVKPINYSDTPDQEKKLKGIFKTMNARLVILIIVLALLMGALIARLYQIQVIDYQNNLALAQELKVVTNSSLNPRGDITDRNGTILVSNRELLTITYSRPSFETTQAMWEKAEIFVSLFDVSFDHFIIRDYQDAYLTFYPKEADELVTEEERSLYLANELSNSQLYQIQVSRVNEELISKLTNEQLKLFAVYQRMAIIPGLIKVIKEDVSAQEVALLLDNINDLGGFNVALDWARQAGAQHQIGAIIGSLYTSEQGLPSEMSSYFLAKDYNIKDAVGRSGLEYQYQDILSGEKAIYTLSHDEEGYAQIETIYEGQPGSTLRTSIDLDYQNHLEEAIIAYMKEKEADANYRYFNKFYLVASDPNTGDILANVAIKRDQEDNYYNSSNSTYLDSYPVGSAIKGAVVYMGLDLNLFRPGETIVDAPMKIQGTSEKSSYVNLGVVNDLTALSNSSNIYMFNVVIRLGQGTYRYNQPLYLKEGTVDTMRQYYSMFGLGNSTQVDVPNEGTGYKSSSALAGNLLDFSIGQYDTYTALQLNQYVSTIANGKYRYGLRFVLDAKNPETNEVVFENKVNILNTIDNSAALDRVKQGFRLCVTDGYCSSFNDAQWPTAAKTGTSQDIARDPFTDEILRDEQNQIIEVSSNSLVAYAPYDNPSIAISCIAPSYVADRIVENGCSAMVEEAINYYAQNH